MQVHYYRNIYQRSGSALKHANTSGVFRQRFFHLYQTLSSGLVEETEETHRPS